MVQRSLILSFEGPPELKPATTDARPLLDVLVRLIELFEKIGAHEGIDDVPPFAVTLTEVRGGSVAYVLDFVPRDPSSSLAPSARRLGYEAARAAPTYLERRDVGPTGIRTKAKKLADALMRLPVAAHLRGSVTASLSELALAPPAATEVAIETFRAKILRAGGLAPRIQLKVPGSERTITLEAPEPLARLAGQTLYAEADVTARIERDVESRVLHGVLMDLRILDEGDPVAAFDRWYEETGRPWRSALDIEQGLGRGDA